MTAISPKYQKDNGTNINEFFYQQGVVMVTASTANLVIGSIGVATVIDGISLLEGDRFLLKDQSISSENGIYVIDGGVAVRHSTANTAAKLTGYVAYIGWNRWKDGNDLVLERVPKNTNSSNVPSANQVRAYLQDNTLTDLSETQNWLRFGTDPLPSKTFTIPDGVFEIDVSGAGAGGGGGGGAGGDDNATPGGGGGGGGAGCDVTTRTLDVTPGQLITIDLGAPGIPGRGGFGANSGSGSRPGIAGTAGGTTIISSTTFSLQFPGGAGGAAGQSYTGTQAAGGSALIKTLNHVSANAGGGGGTANTKSNGSGAAEVFFIAEAPLGAAGGVAGAAGFGGGNYGGGGGGAGGTGVGLGAKGGIGGTHYSSSGGAGSGYVGNSGNPADTTVTPGSGGAGGGGSRGANAGGSVKGAWGSRGSWGGSGYIKISW